MTIAPVMNYQPLLHRFREQMVSYIVSWAQWSEFWLPHKRIADLYGLLQSPVVTTLVDKFSCCSRQLF